MEQHFIVDSTGRKVVLGAPRLLSDVTWATYLWAWITDSAEPVAFHEMTIAGTISVDEHRRMVLEDLAEYPDFWDELDIEDFRGRLSRAQTHRDIIELF